MKRKYILHSPHIEELKKNRRKILKKKIIIFFFCFIVVFVILIFLSKWQKINIENIQISGNQVIETKDINNVVKNNLEGDYLWLFPKTNYILYPKNHIKDTLAEKFKRFSNITIETDNFKKLIVTVTERDGKYLWCGDAIPSITNETDGTKCYFMDSSGYIFDEAPYFSGNVYFKFYGADSNLDSTNPAGSYFLQKYFDQIVTFKENLEKMNFQPSNFFLSPDVNLNEGFISLSGEPNNSPYVTFKLDSDYAKITENLHATISTEPLQTKLKNNFSSLKYFDLKFGNNIYYKFSNEKPTTVKQ